jgi:hypothetical protein
MNMLVREVSLNDGALNALLLADHIEQPGGAFRMSQWKDDYGPCCIAAWATDTAVGRAILRNASPSEICGIAKHWLGLTQKQAELLFTPGWRDVFPDYAEPWHCVDAYQAATEARAKITRKWAAATLRHYAMTGEVDWQAFPRAQTPETERQSLLYEAT